MKKAIIIATIAVAAVSIATAVVAIHRAALTKARTDISIDEKEAE